MSYTIGEGRARVWTYRSPVVGARDEAEARRLITTKARIDVPDATVEILSIRRTPTGRWSAMLKRTRVPALTEAIASGDPEPILKALREGVLDATTEGSLVPGPRMAAHEAGLHDHNESTYADVCPVCRDAVGKDDFDATAFIRDWSKEGQS